MKICALLVPREMQIEHSGSIKQMTDQQIEDAIAAIQAMLAAHEAGENAKVIEASPETPALPAPVPRRKRKLKRTLDVVPNGVDPVSE